MNTKRVLFVVIAILIVTAICPITALADLVGNMTQTFQIGVAIPSNMYSSAGAIGTISVSSGSLPSGVFFNHVGGNWWRFEGTPAPGSANSYPITLIDSGDNNTMDVTITVNPGPQTIVQGSISKKMGDASFTVTPHSTNGNGDTISGTDAPTYTFSAGTDTTVATINSTTGAVTLLKPGSTTVTITSAATNSYTAATNSGTLTFDINVAKADPTIAASNDTAVLGSAKTVAATLTDAYLASTDSITFTATSGTVSVPATATANGNVTFNLSAADTNTLGLGTHTFTIVQTGTVGNTATNNNNVTSITFNLAINGAAPTITSASSYTCTTGTGGTFQVTATGNPSTFTYSLTGQPAGVSINSNTGLITVASTVAAGTYNFSVGATNGVGQPASQAFTLTVNAQSSGSGSGNWYVPPNTQKPPAPVPTPFPAQGTVTGKRITAYMLDTLKGKAAFRLNKNEQFTLLELAENGKALLIQKGELKGYIAIKDFKATLGTQLKATATIKKASVYTMQTNGKLKRIGHYTKDTFIGINGVDGAYLISNQPSVTYYLKAGEWKLANP